MRELTKKELALISMAFLAIASLISYYMGYHDGQLDTRLEYLKLTAEQINVTRGF